MSETRPAPAAFKPKKSVALSGTPAGETALCTVGRSGNDLHYRGYDIIDLAAHHPHGPRPTRQRPDRESVASGGVRKHRRVGQPLAIHEAQAAPPGEVKEASAVRNKGGHGEVAGD